MKQPDPNITCESILLPSRRSSLVRDAMRRFARNRLAVSGFVILTLIVLCPVFGPLIARQSPYAVDLKNFRSPPSRQHWLGTDPAARDVFARVIFGARVSLTVGLFSVGLYVAIGTFLGLFSGYYGGWIDALIMRLTDTMMSLPPLLLMMMLVTLTGPSLFNLILAFGLTRWPSIARLVRGQVLYVREAEFIVAAHAIGVPSMRIVTRHILPNVLAPVIVAASFGVASAILSEASLSFLGLGLRPPTASWGLMLKEAQSISILSGMPWFWIPPGLMIAVCVLSINFVGDGLRDALDPRRQTSS
ncbi:MAG: oligopeptide ABC transporter permease [Anaerolineae bacterium]